MYSSFSAHSSPSAWTADTLVGEFVGIAPDGAGGVVLIGTRASTGNNFTHVLTRVSAAGERTWSRTVASTVMRQVNGNELRLARDPASSSTMIAWADDRETSRCFHAQAVDADGQPMWGDSGVVVATCSIYSLLLGASPDKQGGLWVALLDYDASWSGVIRYQHLGEDGSAQWPDTAMALRMNSSLARTTDPIPYGPGGFWIGSNPPSASWVQRIRPNGSLAFGPNGATVPGPLVTYPALPSLGGLLSDRIMVA